MIQNNLIGSILKLTITNDNASTMLILIITSLYRTIVIFTSF